MARDLQEYKLTKDSSWRFHQITEETMLTIKIHTNSFYIGRKKYELTSPTFPERVDQARCYLILFEGLNKSDLSKINFIDATLPSPTRIPRAKSSKLPKVSRQPREKISLTQKYRYITIRKSENVFVLNLKKCNVIDASDRIETSFTNLETCLTCRNKKLAKHPKFYQAVLDADNGNSTNFYRIARSGRRTALGEKYISIRRGKYQVRINKKCRIFPTLELAREYRDSIVSLL